MPDSGAAARTATAATLRALFDDEWGGFGTGAKDPEPRLIDLLLRHSVAERDARALEMATRTLTAIASGGIYDHLGGGFWHASTDRRWQHPDFEKRLLDQALLCRTYLHAWQITGSAQYLQITEETLAFVFDVLRTPDGVFMSSLDASSEGEVGRHYLWTRHQIESVLGADAPEFCAWFGIASEDSDEPRIFRRSLPGELRRPATVELSRIRLLSSRDMRIPPRRDETVHAAANAEMLAALAEAALATANHRWLGASVRAAEGLLARLRRPDGRWVHRWVPDEPADDSAGAAADSLDLALLVNAFTRVGEASGTARWIGEAEAVAEHLLDHWWLDDVRRFGSDDGTEQSAIIANSRAVAALARLAACTGSSHLRERATSAGDWLSTQLAAHLASGGDLDPEAIAAVELVRSSITQVVVADADEEVLDAVRPRFLPTAVVSWGEPLDSPMWADKDMGASYVCHGAICTHPARSPAELAAQLEDLYPQPFVTRRDA